MRGNETSPSPLHAVATTHGQMAKKKNCNGGPNPVDSKRVPKMELAEAQRENLDEDDMKWRKLRLSYMSQVLARLQSKHMIGQMR